MPIINEVLRLAITSSVGSFVGDMGRAKASTQQFGAAAVAVGNMAANYLAQGIASVVMGVTEYNNALDKIQVSIGASNTALVQFQRINNDTISKTAVAAGVFSTLAARVAEYKKALATPEGQRTSEMQKTIDELGLVTKALAEYEDITGDASQATADNLTNIAQVFQRNDLGNMMDTLYAGSEMTGKALSYMSQQAQAAAPLMTALGYSFEETVGLIVSFNKSGIDFSAITSILGRNLTDFGGDVKATKAYLSSMFETLKSVSGAEAVRLYKDIMPSNQILQLWAAARTGAGPEGILEEGLQLGRKQMSVYGSGGGKTLGTGGEYLSGQLALANTGIDDWWKDLSKKWMGGAYNAFERIMGVESNLAALPSGTEVGANSYARYSSGGEYGFGMPLALGGAEPKGPAATPPSAAASKFASGQAFAPLETSNAGALVITKTLAQQYPKAWAMFLSLMTDTQKTALVSGVNQGPSTFEELVNAINSMQKAKGMKVTTIPKMAQGGLVKTPTLALIGEAGPELVVPLSELGGAVNEAPSVGPPMQVTMQSTEALTQFTINANSRLTKALLDSALARERSMVEPYKKGYWAAYTYGGSTRYALGVITADTKASNEEIAEVIEETWAQKAKGAIDGFLNTTGVDTNLFWNNMEAGAKRVLLAWAEGMGIDTAGLKDKLTEVEGAFKTLGVNLNDYWKVVVDIWNGENKRGALGVKAIWENTAESMMKAVGGLITNLSAAWASGTADWKAIFSQFGLQLLGSLATMLLQMVLDWVITAEVIEGIKKAILSPTGAAIAIGVLAAGAIAYLIAQGATRSKGPTTEGVQRHTASAAPSPEDYSGVPSELAASSLGGPQIIVHVDSPQVLGSVDNETAKKLARGISEHLRLSGLMTQAMA